MSEINMTEERLKAIERIANDDGYIMADDALLLAAAIRSVREEFAGAQNQPPTGDPVAPLEVKAGERVYLTGYYYRLEVDGSAVTVGFATHAELVDYLKAIGHFRKDGERP